MTGLLLQLGTSGLGVVLAGIFLARYGDVIGTRTRLGGMWAGMVLLALATSLPELATGVVAVRQGAHDLAAGNLFGSSLANLLILAILDLSTREGVLRRASAAHMLPACLAIVLNALAAALVLLRTVPVVRGVSLASILLIVVYGLGGRAIYMHTRVEIGSVLAAPGDRRSGRLSIAVLGFSLACLAVFVVAPYFARGAEELAELTGLGTTFIGTLLVGLSTSLPELAASWAAVRMGAVDLAVGNVWGSNAFNMTMFLAFELARPARDGAAGWFALLDPAHALTGLFSVALMAFAMSGILTRAPRRYGLLVPSGLTLLLGYVGAMLALRLATR